MVFQGVYMIETLQGLDLQLKDSQMFVCNYDFVLLEVSRSSSPHMTRYLPNMRVAAAVVLESGPEQAAEWVSALVWGLVSVGLMLQRAELVAGLELAQAEEVEMAVYKALPK